MFEPLPIPPLPLYVGFALLEEAFPNAPWGAPYISTVYTPRNQRENDPFPSGRHRKTRDEEENAENIN
jgi:hypothetical protein